MEIWDIYDEDRNLTGRKAIRGVPMEADDYHLVVHVWLVNSKDEILISKRTPNKTHPNMWECTGGSAVEGDSSLDAACREVQEELGLDITDASGQMLYSNRFKNDTASYFSDVWLFSTEVKIKDLVFQVDEVMDAKWVTMDGVKEMIDQGEFLSHFSYLDELFNYIENL